MAYDNITSRADARVLETTQQIRDEIIQGIIKGSSILPLITKLPNMTSSQTEMPVLGSLPDAYWVSGDTGLKQTTKMMWDKKRIYAEELAVIVPIPIAVLEDSDYDIFAQYKPRIIEKMYQKIDQAIILGLDKPAKWREGLITSIINAGGAVAPSLDLSNIEDVEIPAWLKNLADILKRDLQEGDWVLFKASNGTGLDPLIEKLKGE